MKIEQLGGVLLLAVIAGLWMIYLVPSWFDRKRSTQTAGGQKRVSSKIAAQAALATDGHASELASEEFDARKLVISAKESERKRKMELRQHKSLTKIEAKNLAKQYRQEQQRQKMEAKMSSQRRAANRRRGRLAASFFLLVGAAAVTVGAVYATSFSWAVWVLFGGLGAITLSINILNALAKVARSQAHRSAVESPVFVDHGSSFEQAEPPADSSSAEDRRLSSRRGKEWTPVPVPQPLYLSRDEIMAAAIAEAERADSVIETTGEQVETKQTEVDVAATVAAEIENAQQALAAASEESIAALRAAQEADEVERIEQAAGAPAKGYGWLEELEKERAAAALSSSELDDVIRRRREVS